MPGSHCRRCGWSREGLREICPECGEKVVSFSLPSELPAGNSDAPEIVEQIGKRVHVANPILKRNCGLGTIVNVTVVDASFILTEIKLDSGHLTGAREFWLQPVTMEWILDLVKRAIAKYRKIALARVGDDYVCQTPTVIFCQVVEGVFGAKGAAVFIDDDESLTVRELAGMIWEYVK